MFLEVKFHDNDFSCAFMDALFLLFESVSRYSKSSKDTFIMLNERGALKNMLINMVAADDTIKQIRWSAEAAASRGSGWETPGWIVADQNAGYTTKYFSNVELKFHDTDDFIDEDHNSEHCWLNLKTGEAGVF